MRLQRRLTLWRLFRKERDEPGPFYSLLAREAVEELERHYGSLAGQTILDLGCGRGFYTRALRGRGAEVIPVDNDPAELELAGPTMDGAVLADARDLPLADASVDAVFCSNLLEHTPDTGRVLAEIERVLRPHGWAYVSWTNWYSPWGGHDMTPYQYLGPRFGPRLYERLHGPPRKNAYGESLFPVHIGKTLRLARGRPQLEVERVEPRYWPRLALLCRVPGLRELVTWNCVIRLRKRAAGASSYEPAGILRRLRDHVRSEGPVPVARRSVRWLAGYAAGMLRRPGAGTFQLGGETYRYLHHRYNATWLNERAVEIPVVERAVEAANGARILEVGNVLSHYGPRTHCVVDRYERVPGVIPTDVLQHRPLDRYDLIVSVSTLEHVGLDERPRDPTRAVAAIQHLRELLAPGGKLLMTLPVGYNRELDRAIATGELQFSSLRALRRRERHNEWHEVDVTEIWDVDYDLLLYTAHGVLVCELDA